jgi:hypothetical protein
LAERLTAATGTCVGAHQSALAEFGERVEGDQPAPRLDCTFVLAGSILLHVQAMQDIADRREGAVAFRRQPFLKRLGDNIEIG